MSTLEAYGSHRRGQFEVQILEGSYASPTPVLPPHPHLRGAKQPALHGFYLVAGGDSCSLAGRDGLWLKYPTLAT